MTIALGDLVGRAWARELSCGAGSLPSASWDSAYPFPPLRTMSDHPPLDTAKAGQLLTFQGRNFHGWAVLTVGDYTYPANLSVLAFNHDNM